jgi:hypothetical protein
MNEKAITLRVKIIQAPRVSNNTMKTTLIAGTSHGDNQQPSTSKDVKVQRLDRKIVHSSEWKWVVSL